MNARLTSHPRRLATAAVLCAAAAAAISGCASTTAPAEALTADNHIHDLVPDPDGQTLLIGSHNGLFTVDVSSGAVAGPVGEQSIDLMGLAAADGALIASGHPGSAGAQQLRGPNVGLIRSDDEGESWEAVSLDGLADFHALAYDPEARSIIGAHAGQILLSDDMGATWREGAAVDPYDLLATDRGLLMTSVAGLASSPDGGESFQQVEGAPAVVLLAATEDTVIGVDLEGTLWRSGPDGQWAAEGAAPGQVFALAALPSGDVIVSTESGLQRTSDLGQSWQPLIP